MNALGSTCGALTGQQIAAYERDGFLHGIPVLSPEEVQRFRRELDRACEALGGDVARLDHPHRIFSWAWDLATHPRVLDCLEDLLGPNLLLKNTKIFYKRPHTDSFVAWHQDGSYDDLRGSYVPVVWVALTDTTVENGCLRVVPGSHHDGMTPHVFRPHHHNLTGGGLAADVEIGSAFNILMRAGEMSLHHPMLLHGSEANRSSGPRIGFASTYFTPELSWSADPVALLRGEAPRDRYEFLNGPPQADFDQAVQEYLALHASEIRYVSG